MKKFFYFIFIGLSIFSCKMFIPSTIIPYSMIKLGEGEYIDQTEITVEQWAEFVYDGHEDKKPAHSQSAKYRYHQVFYPDHQPDSIFKAFGKLDYYPLPVTKEYFDSLNYTELREILDFPITGISYQDALDYCNWRTEKYQSISAHTQKSIVFELPPGQLYSDTNGSSTKDQQVVYHSQKDAREIYGLTDNVAEMYNKMPKSQNLEKGFRCYAIIH